MTSLEIRRAPRAWRRGATRPGRLGLSCSYLCMVCGCAPLEIRYETTQTDDAPLVLPDPVRSPSGPVGVPSAPDVGSPLPIGPPCEQFPLECPQSDATRCALVDTPRGFAARCVPESGDRPVGQSCERFSEGSDTCLTGGFCSSLGIAPNDSMRCRQLCDSNEGCALGERCFQVDGELGRGVCVGECALFAGGCGDPALRCAVALDVDQQLFGTCARFGIAQEGADCILSEDCGSGLMCQGANGKCRALCDTAHPCPKSMSCIAIAFSSPSGPSLCLP